jgi:hypothetical protein
MEYFLKSFFNLQKENIVRISNMYPVLNLGYYMVDEALVSLGVLR